MNALGVKAKHSLSNLANKVKTKRHDFTSRR